MSALRLLCVVVVVVVGGCHDPPARAPLPGPTTAAADMCSEHRVLEVLCTRHHPALIAVFKAKGDWCNEHEYPESICPLCHPERGGRPTTNVDSDDDGAPADGTKVRLLRPSLAEQAGIATVKAVAKDVDTGVAAAARVVYDATKVAVVNARASGVVRALRVDVGSKVKRGAVLAVVDSASVGADRGGLIAARARLQLATSAAARERGLLQRGIAAQKEVDQVEAEVEAARADVVAAEAAVAGVNDGKAGAYDVVAPAAGVVVERSVAAGQSVGQDAPLFVIVDPSTVWAELDVAERDLAVVAEGQPVTLTVDALPERRFDGVIQSLALEIDPRTRTVRARTALDNRDGALRAQMLGRARIAVAGARVSVWVPRAAVQAAKSVWLVFTKENADGVYVAHRVVTGAYDGDLIEVVKGVDAGADVVTSGAFLLKTETMKDALGAGCCE